MSTMYKFILYFTLFLLTHIAHASNINIVSKFIETIEGVCLFNRDDFSHIDKMATALKLKPIPNSELQGDLAIASRGGKGYFIEDSGHKFMIAYVNGGGCGVVSPPINFKEFKTKLLSVYKLSHIETEDEGMQITEFYRFNTESSYAGDYLIITHMRDRQENDIVSVSYLPRK